MTKIYPLGEAEEVWMERGRKAVQTSTPTEEQTQDAKAEATCLTPKEAEDQRRNLLHGASAIGGGKVDTVTVFRAGFYTVRIDGWPIGQVSGGRGKSQRVRDLVKEHYQKRAARLIALDFRLSLGDRQEVLDAEAALDKLTPSEARRLIETYTTKLDKKYPGGKTR